MEGDRLENQPSSSRAPQLTALENKDVKAALANQMYSRNKKQKILCKLDLEVDHVLQQFSKENIMVENNTIALCKELEEELKWSSEEPCSHTWYYGVLPQEVSPELRQRNGEDIQSELLFWEGCCYFNGH
ncbi:hypothetical protein GN956_G5553 [Arapaima gigas]